MPTPLFKPGTPKPPDSGRKKGTPNKITLTVKEQIELCYVKIGGDKRFAEWADANPDLFYVHIYPKIIPKDINVTGTIGVAQLLIEAGEAMKLVESRIVPSPSLPAPGSGLALAPTAQGRDPVTQNVESVSRVIDAPPPLPAPPASS